MVMNVPDKYDKAVAWLTKNPNYIYSAWDRAFCCPIADSNYWSKEQIEAHEKAACLFENCGSGCLTQVAHGDGIIAGTRELTRAIRADKDNIPRGGSAITAEDLPLFANWRRRIDKELAKASS